MHVYLSTIFASLLYEFVIQLCYYDPNLFMIFQTGRGHSTARLALQAGCSLSRRPCPSKVRPPYKGRYSTPPTTSLNLHWKVNGLINCSDSGSTTLGPGPRIQHPGCCIQDPGSRVLDTLSGLDPGSWTQAPGFGIQGQGSWIQAPGSGPGTQTWGPRSQVPGPRVPGSQVPMDPGPK